MLNNYYDDMKTLLILLFYVCIAYNEALLTQRQQNEAVEQCAAQTGITAKSIKKLGDKLQMPKNDPAVEPYLSCVYKKHGLVDEEGNILFEKVRDQLRISFYGIDADEIVERCKKKLGNKPEENVYLVTKCIMKNVKRSSNVKISLNDLDESSF